VDAVVRLRQLQVNASRPHRTQHPSTRAAPAGDEPPATAEAEAARGAYTTQAAPHATRPDFPGHESNHSTSNLTPGITRRADN